MGHLSERRIIRGMCSKNSCGYNGSVDVSDIFDPDEENTVVKSYFKDPALISESLNCEDGGEVKSMILNLVYCD